MSTPKASALLVWNGYEVAADLTCSCGEVVAKNHLSVGDVIECGGCHRIWRPCRTVACEPATPREIADYLVGYYGTYGAEEWKRTHSCIRCGLTRNEAEAASDAYCDVTNGVPHPRGEEQDSQHYFPDKERG